jgi:glutamate synthase domain-containing protein 3
MESKKVMDTQGIYYRDLNERIREAVQGGTKEIDLLNVSGQRYIGTALAGDLKITINGVAGQDTAAFMCGPKMRINGNAQDGLANTMDKGEVYCTGMSGDVLGYAMRGGQVHVLGDVGYRAGIHMKAYKDKLPTIVIGGRAGDFLGEYMAGGIIILLGLFGAESSAPIAGKCLATGIHGGTIFVRGQIPEYQLADNLLVQEADAEDLKMIEGFVDNFCREFGKDKSMIMDSVFLRIRPRLLRPYGNMYVPN